MIGPHDAQGADGWRSPPASGRAERQTLTAFLYRPEVRQVVYQVAAAGGAGVRRLVGRQQRRRKPAPAEHRLGFRFPRPHVRLRRLAIADRVLQRLHLRPRLLGGPAQHAAGGRPRHRRRDGHRLHRRHRPALLQLADRAAGHGLRGGRAQPAAAAAAVLLVLRRTQEPARPAPELRRCPAAPFSMCAGSICRRPCRSPGSSRSPSPSRSACSPPSASGCGPGGGRR